MVFQVILSMHSMYIRFGTHSLLNNVQDTPYPAQLMHSEENLQAALPINVFH